MGDANKPVAGVSHKDSEDPRDLDCGPKGGIAKAGYERIARRPRTRSGEIMREGRADSIESLYKDFNPSEPWGMDEY
jgi:hypothetical protein